MQLDDTRRDELQKVARTAVGRVSERAHFVLMNEQGIRVKTIGTLMGYDPRSVGRWLKRYKQKGIAGLYDEPRSGRPKLEPHLTDLLETQAGQPPTVYGYLQSVWTVALLALHLFQRYQVQVSASTVRRTLHAIRFSWHRPKLWPAHRRDPERVVKEAYLAEVLADPHLTLVAADESEVHLLAILRSCWQRIGAQWKLPTPGQNARRSIFGGLNLRTGQWHFSLTDHKRSADFIAFLSALLVIYGTGPIGVIVDNASIHHSQALLLWLVGHPRIHLVFLPTYSGHRLNPVEKVWWLLKQYISANRNFGSLAELDRAVLHCFAGFTPAQLLGLTNCDVNRHAQAAFVTAGQNFQSIT